MANRADAVTKTFELAKERYAELGVDVSTALQRLSLIPISLHCWQGDDVSGFENTGTQLGGGLAVTGNYPGKAQNPEQLRADIDLTLSLLPGRHRLNLHACYGEFGGKITDRDQITVSHFQGWIDWAKNRKIGLDFNPTYFAHPKAADGFTLSHANREVRQFWVNHGIACRQIGAAMGEALGSPCVTNVWIPDGYKDMPVDRAAPRRRLAESLDQLFGESLDPCFNLDAIEPKLFGIGSESYVVGSHEFYLGYAIQNRKMLCLDAGHFHPTETISDKISSVLQWTDRLLLHVSRGVRWDSDHVVVWNDELLAIAQELVRGKFLNRVHIGLDFFDASINRIAAWTIGARSMIKALLAALLEPAAKLQELEAAGDFTSRLALLEECKTLPLGAVWDYYCLTASVPIGENWLAEVKTYERDILAKR